MKPTESLSVSNFLSTYVFDPTSDSLSHTDRKIALGWTIGLGIISLGLFHLGLAIVHGAKKFFCAKKIKSSPQKLQNQAEKIDNLKINSSNPVVRLNQQQLDIHKKQSLSPEKISETERPKKIEQLKALNPTKMNFIYAAGILTEHPIYSWGLREGRAGDIYCVFKKGEKEEDYIEFCLTKSDSPDWESLKNKLQLKDENYIIFEKKPIKESSPFESERAKSITQEAEACIRDLRVEMNFSTIERFKKVKDKAKKLINQDSTSPNIKREMEKIIQQYKEIVDGSEVLSILKKLSQEIRKPQMIKEDNYSSKLIPDRRLISRFFKLIGDWSDLENTYQYKKDEWKEKWTGIREKIWNASLEANDFLKSNKKFTFITGSNTASLPLIMKIGQLAPALAKKPSLIPTGHLLAHHIVPLSGEMAYGVSEGGINQTGLSGMKFLGLDVCLDYSSGKAFRFDEEAEYKIIEDILNSDDKFFSISLPRLRIALLRLLRMGAKTESYEEIKELINKKIGTIKHQNIIKEGWHQYASLINTPCKQQGQKPTEDLQIGQIVAVPRTGFNGLKYGIVKKRAENGWYCIIVERPSITKNLELDDITLISDENLAKDRTSFLPQNEIDDLKYYFLGEKEKLEDMLKLFINVKPFVLSKDELDLIQSPFPIVWASVSLKPEGGVRSDIRGEHIFKGHAALGDDIQVVFTNFENVSRLENIVKDLGVKVLSFEAAHYILGHDQDSKYKNYWD